MLYVAAKDFLKMAWPKGGTRTSGNPNWFASLGPTKFKKGEGPPPEVQRKAILVKQEHPLIPAFPGTACRMASTHKGFAVAIREKTHNGFDLIDAIYNIFQRSYDAGKYELTMEAATWLADRGFGKPVQVGQLLDAEGNAVAFQLWAPAIAKPAEDGGGVISYDIIEEAKPAGYLPSPESLQPKVYVVPKPDGYAEGPAKSWKVWDDEPRKGE